MIKLLKVIRRITVSRNISLSKLGSKSKGTDQPVQIAMRMIEVMRRLC